MPISFCGFGPQHVNSVQPPPPSSSRSFPPPIGPPGRRRHRTGGSCAAALVVCSARPVRGTDAGPAALLCLGRFQGPTQGVETQQLLLAQNVRHFETLVQDPVAQLRVGWVCLRHVRVTVLTPELDEFPVHIHPMWTPGLGRRTIDDF